MQKYAVDNVDSNSRLGAALERVRQSISENPPQIVAPSILHPVIRNYRHSSSVSEIKSDREIAPVPTDFLRVSIFSVDPVTRPSTGIITYESNYGTAKVIAPVLRTRDESVAFALMLESKRRGSVCIDLNFKTLCGLVGLSYQTKNIKSIKDSLHKLIATAYSFPYEEDGKKRFRMRSIVTGADGNNEWVRIRVDQWFRDKFLANEVTSIDLDFRNTLSSDLAKSLHCFLATHSGTGAFKVETLVDQLLMNPEQPEKKKRFRLNAAFDELQKKGFLRYKFNRKSGVFFNIRKSKGHKK